MSETATERILIENHLARPDAAEERRELREALTSNPRRIPSKYFYDDLGSHLFEDITRLEEYYPTRAEAALLRQVADPIITASGATELVELGSGAATKTRLLLDAMQRAGKLEIYVPVDVSEVMVRRVAEELIEEYPDLRVHGLIANFMEDLGRLPESEHRLVAFLGGTIGNLEPETEAVAFLEHLKASMAPEDCLLLGTDLIKETARIEAAYDDSQGVTAEFNRNILRVINRRFGGDFVPQRFRHRAFFHPEHRWIEMRLVSESRQTVRFSELDLVFELSAGEEILTEISTKYDRPRLEQLYRASGFELMEWLPGEGLFALSLARPVID